MSGRHAAFPWIELIPFVLYIPAVLYSTTPNNVLYQMGLQEIGALTIPLATLAACVCAVVGFAYLFRLRGWRRITTLILSILHAALFGTVQCGTAYLIIQVLLGNLTV